MKNNIFLLFFVLPGCIGNNNQQRESKIERNDQIFKLDSLKWFMYALNSYGKVQANDSAFKKTELTVVSCDIRLSAEYKSHDTLAYAFDFVKKGYNGIWVDQALPVRGITIYDDNKYSLQFPHIKPDFARSPDSVKWYMEKADKSFRQYLKNYEGEIAPWLKEEMLKRKIK